MTRPKLKDLLPQSEFSELVQARKTLQEICDIVEQRSGHRYSTGAASKLARTYGVQLPRGGPRSGELHKGWKGGRILNKDGYVELYRPGHPNAKKHTRYMLEHRLVMEEKLGRFLKDGEVVHHKNGVKTDNRPENLELFQSNALHLASTLKGKTPNWSEEGKRKIADAQKKGGAVPHSAELRRFHRYQCLVRSAIQKALRLRGAPNNAQCHHYLAQFGMTFRQTLDMASSLGLECDEIHPMLERESLRQSGQLSSAS